jgi:nicotinate-nucleotide adenylyltransferase
MQVAGKVSRLFEIDELWFVLARVAPHKQKRPVTPALHRYAMLALATAAEPRFFISSFELDRAGPAYTVDTLTHFKTEWGESVAIYFIMGADSWSEIMTWHDCSRLLTATNHIVVTRPGYQLGCTHVGPEVVERIVDLRGVGLPHAATIIERETQERIFFTDVVLADISATDIRRTVKEEGCKLTNLVPQVVAEYIGKYQLYRDLE